MNNKQKQIHTIDTVFPLCTGIGSFRCPCIPGYNGWIKAELYYSDSGNVFAGKGAGVQQ